MVPQGDSFMYISWPTIGVICGLITLIMGIGGRWFTLSINSALTTLSANLEKKIEERFSSKASVEGELKLINLRMQHIETQLVDMKQSQARQHQSQMERS